MNNNQRTLHPLERVLGWADWTICSLWVLSALGDATYWSSLMYAVILLLAVLRLSFTFAMVQREKLAWMPLLLILAIVWLPAPRLPGVEKLVTYPFHLLQVEFNPTPAGVLAVAVYLWVGALPLVWYGIQLFRKKLVRTPLRPRDVMGALLWTDRRARIATLLLLTALVCLYVGLAGHAQLSRTACLLAPLFAWWLIVTYYHTRLKAWWLLPVAMLLFYYAQPLSGEWRLLPLIVSLLLVAYMGYRLLRHTRRAVLSLLVVGYTGVLLPTLTIGYNPYACLDYGRYKMLTLQPYNGIFYIRHGDLIGLRDRSGLLLKPEYDDICYPADEQTWGVVELRKNGYVSLYNILNGTMQPSNSINHRLQDSICLLLNRHWDSHGYQSADRLEVKVINQEASSPRLLAHVKMSRSGSKTLYNYSSRPYIGRDTLTLSTGNYATDTLHTDYGDILHSLRYATNVNTPPLGNYRMEVSLLRQDIPHPKELTELEACIEKCLLAVPAGAGEEQ